MKALFFLLLTFVPCTILEAQTALPAGQGRFQGVSAVMPTSSQIAPAAVGEPTMEPAPQDIARLRQMTPRMPEAPEIVTDVPPALRKPSLGAARAATPEQVMQSDPPMRAIEAPSAEQKD